MGAHLEDFPMTEFGWSEDRVTTLKTLWLDGLSASQVAKELGGVTRNAVIGKVHRLGLSGRAQPSKPTRLQRPKREAAPKRTAAGRAPPASPRPPLPSRVEAVAEGPGLVSSMTALGAHVCRWPIGDPKADDFSFCGRLASGPYCPTHKAQAFRPGTAWRADRDPAVRKVLAGRAA
jgi:GcrA cell cycle regulator